MAYRRAGSLEAAVRASLTAKPPAAGDRAVAELALRIAQAIDSDGADARLAAQLLAALEALQMSPRARAQAHRGEVKDVPPTANPLDQLAAARRRKSRAAPVDAGAP